MGCGRSKAVVADSGTQVGNFHHKFDLDVLLGNGAYGSVWMARNVESSERLAVKVLDLNTRQKNSNMPTRRQVREAVNAERRAWTIIGFHPNIVSLRETFEDGRFAYFVMELCDHSLLEAWRNEADLTECTYARYFKEMAKALNHLHYIGLVHRDVKHDNFMVGAPDGRTVKLCDFGLSAFLRPGGLSGHFGTAPYMAPEMFYSTHGPPTDVWSLGVIVYIAFFGCWPYQPIQKTVEEMHNAIWQGKVLPSFAPARKFQQCMVSEAGINFVKALLNRNPLARPSAALTLEMEFLTKGQRNPQEENISLAQLLEAAKKCGAFNLKQPKVDDRQVMALNRLQRTARSRRETLSSTRTEFCGPTTATSDVFRLSHVFPQPHVPGDHDLDSTVQGIASRAVNKEADTAGDLIALEF